MKIKNILKTLLVISLIIVTSTSCGNSGNAGTKKEGKKSESTTKETVKLGVVGAISEEIWAPAKEKLAKEGINLELVQFSDYITPNNALNSGEIDLNAFQHQIFLDTDAKDNGYKIETIGYTFIIPLNLYSNKIKDVKEIKSGDKIAIPNDVTNGGRSLKVLESAGLIKLKEDAPLSPLVSDIEKYNVEIEIVELAANTIPATLDDVTAAIINGGFALDYGLKTDEAIFKDTSLDQKEYWNLIAARSQDTQKKDEMDKYKKVVEAFQTDETKKVFDEKFGGYFISAGWDIKLFAN